MLTNWIKLLLLLPFIWGSHPAIGYRPMSVVSASKRYGSINTKTWTWTKQKQWIVSIPLSHPFKDSKGRPVTAIKVNRDIAEPLKLVLKDLESTGLIKEIKSFYGSVSIRSVRGTRNRISTHAYGLALDLGMNDSWSTEFIRIWENYGFVWGGRWCSRKDSMHFSRAWEIKGMC